MKRIFKISSRVTCVLLACVILLCSALLSACGGGDGYPVTVGGVTLKTAPENVTVLSANAADVMINLGYAGSLVGKSDSCKQSSIEVVPSVGVASSPDVDAIVNAGTDTVFADETLGEVYLNSLNEAGINVFCFAQPQTDSEIATMYNSVAVIMAGSKEGAKNAQAEYEALYENLNSAQAQASGAGAAVYTVCYLSLDGNGELVIPEADSFVYKVIGATGSSVITAEDAEGSSVAETLAERNPAVIFYDSGAVLDKLKSDADTAELFAIANGRCFEYSLSDLNLVGISAIQNVAELLKLLYPDDGDDTPEEGTSEPSGGSAGSDSSVAAQYGLTLSEGMTIDADSGTELIKALQERLKDLGYYSGDADGVFGDYTEQCVKDFQFLNNFVVDAEADYDVLACLFSDEAVHRQN